ncbi:RHS repeat-associated core domain-containing protein [Pseudomonas sp. DCB_CB]|uniref:RHS repeat-associated core domain-containing protein n=1 Tax=Pseudomonas TaxID=286 RepID=UPI000C2A8336|nr:MULTISPECIES: RHS repeat-associated core domain-containing protein [Pseudomonas]EKT4542192.1 RHS repeat-associated core domain-containing protein [Pseudomonas putida]EKT4566088.1 RHS repeat-associated core domain-containing protein [Pseudomonas putida]MCE0906893.1 RHS repeat-associated core domain-containing protein [Pseudomonas alloputida]MCE1051460.1 RHS repeat-associated core domain-containing protein [Pseudomonas alloputida]MCX2693731.1 RHS repeat-associated core domain-containing prote
MSASNTVIPDTHVSYCVYGYSKALTLKPRLTGFNGAHFDPHAHYYHLGQGYRAFSPTLMRFISPDRISPFGRGGINSYTYCNGDPVNRTDPSGAVAFARLAHLALRPLNWAYKIFFKKPNINVNFNKQNVQLPGQSPEETARLRLIAMGDGLRILNKLSKPAPHLKLSKPAPHLVEKIGQYLAPGDLTAAAAASDPFKTGVTPRIVHRITTERYLKQAANIMGGQVTDYRNDGLLTKANISNLDRIEAEVRKMQNPSYFGDSDHYISPQERYRKLMRHINIIRSSLEHPELWS